MELSAKDKFMRLFLSKKKFVIYVLEKQIADMELSYKSSERRLKESEDMFSAAIQKTKQSEIDIISIEDRNLTLSVLVEGKSEEYKAAMVNKRNDESSVDALALIVRELVEEQVRNEETLANNRNSIKVTNTRIRDMRRTLSELRSSTNNLLQQLNELNVRKDMIEAMDKTQVGLDILESKNLQENATVASKILEAQENQQSDWRANRDSNPALTAQSNAVEDRLNQALGETTRKALN